MKPSFAVLTASLTLASLCPLQAQTSLVDWGQLWNFMHPTGGTLPAGSGTTVPHPIGSAPWFAAQAIFDVGYTGPSFSTTGVGFQAGLGAGPLGYGTITYMGTPLPPPAEFTAHGTVLDTPATGSRYTGYFRTTFTVPDDGKLYSEPVIRYILDDGGFIYLNGVLVLRVNINAGINDTYTALAANTASTETHIRAAQLNLRRGSITGGNTAVVPGIIGNATVVQQVASLAPGIHTLAVAAHNQGTGSSDLLMALQLQAGQADCILAATVSDVTRDPNGTANDPNDDKIDLMVRIVPTGIASASWEISEPVRSSAIGQGGAYNSDIPITGIPIAEFGGGGLTLVIADSDDPFCNTRINIFPPRIIATDETAGSDVAIGTTGPIPSGWVFDDASRTMVMNNGGGGARKVVTSSVVDLSARREILFTGVLQVDDTSSGTENNDSFLAYLIIDGDALNPINLITPYDTQLVDGVLSDDELALGSGIFVLDLSAEIPASASSVQIVIEGINNSTNETFTVRDLRFFRPPGLFFKVEGSGTDLMFIWESRSEAIYNLRSVTDPSDPSAGVPGTWPIWDGHSAIVATPPSNTLTIPRPADPSRYFVIESTPIPPLFEDDFESGPGLWTMGSDEAPGTAWELGVPVNGPGVANSLVNCFGTNLTADYGFDVNVWLRSPPIDLTTVPSATLCYQQFTDIEPPQTDPFTVYDFGKLSVLDADTGLVLAVIQTDITGFSLLWEKVTWAVPAAALGHVVRFEFRMDSDDIANFPGWYIDDVLVTVP